MTKRILILLFAVLLTGTSEDVDSDCSDGGDYGHGKIPPPVCVYVDDDTDNCMWMNSLDALDPVDQESTEE